jgi:hypothetical protein
MSHAKLPGVSSGSYCQNSAKSADLDLMSEMAKFLAESSLIAMLLA